MQKTKLLIPHSLSIFTYMANKKLTYTLITAPPIATEMNGQ